MVKTVSDLKAAVAAEFPRNNIPGWATYFDTNIEQWIYELCDFPFWFLEQRPSPAFFSNFPIVDYTVIPLQYGQWALNGWLILVPGQTIYSLAAPFEEDHEAGGATWWSIFRAASINSAKLHDDSGYALQDLEMLGSNVFQSRFLTYGGSGGGEPQYMTLRTTESGSSLVVWPRPTKNYALSVSWTMREAPIYTRPTDPTTQYSKFLSFAPTAIQYKALAQTASFFDEQDMMAKFLMGLYGQGSPKTDMNSVTQAGGIIGKLKEETLAMHRQTQQQAGWYQSQAQAIGRRDSYGNSRVPYGFGYRL